MTTAGKHSPEGELPYATYDVSEEEPSSGEDIRPEFSAESLSLLGRLALAFLTLLGAVATFAGIVTALVRPAALFELGGLAAAMIAGLVSLIWMLQILFGALLENNRAIGVIGHRMWMVAFILTGPFGLLFYWFLHVWPAAQRPHDEGMAPRARRRATPG